MADRCTDAELAQREADALELLASGCGTAYSAQILAQRYGCSLRTARRYVQSATFDLVEDVSPHEIDRQFALALHRLDLVAGKAAASGDEATAIRATRSLTAALASYRRAISAPAVRFRLPTSRTALPLGGAADPPF